jgi:hypothetical protein
MLKKERRDRIYTAIIYCKKYLVNPEIDDVVIRLNHQVKYSEVQEVCKLYSINLNNYDNN